MLIQCHYRKLSAKNAKLARPTLFNYIFTREEYELYANRLFTMMAEGDFKLRIHDTYPLKDVARAHNVSLHLDVFAKAATNDCSRISRVGRLWANCS